MYRKSGIQKTISQSAVTELNLGQRFDRVAHYKYAYANEPGMRLVFPYQDQMEEADIKELARRAWHTC